MAELRAMTVRVLVLVNEQPFRRGLWRIRWLRFAARLLRVPMKVEVERGNG